MIVPLPSFLLSFCMAWLSALNRLCSSSSASDSILLVGAAAAAVAAATIFECFKAAFAGAMGLHVAVMLVSVLCVAGSAAAGANEFLSSLNSTLLPARRPAVVCCSPFPLLLEANDRGSSRTLT
jgi:hypothetical protein